LRRLEHGHLRPAGEALEQALACWRNPPLPDLPDAPEVAAQCTWLLKERELAWLTLADILLALGDHGRSSCSSRACRCTARGAKNSG
jgi:hypothetical protein